MSTGPRLQQIDILLRGFAKTYFARLHQLKSVGVLLGSNTLATATIAAGTLLVTKLTTPVEFGKYAYAAQVAVSIYPLLTLRYEHALPLLGNRRIASSYLLGCLMLLFATTGILLIFGQIGLSIPIFAAHLPREVSDMFSLVATGAFALALSSIFQAATLGRGTVVHLAIARVLRAIVMVSMQIMLVLLIGAGAYWLLLGEASANLLHAAILAIAFGLGGAISSPIYMAAIVATHRGAWRTIQGISAHHSPSHVIPFNPRIAVCYYPRFALWSGRPWPILPYAQAGIWCARAFQYSCLPIFDRRSGARASDPDISGCLAIAHARRERYGSRCGRHCVSRASSLRHCGRRQLVDGWRNGGGIGCAYSNGTGDQHICLRAGLPRASGHCVRHSCRAEHGRYRCHWYCRWAGMGCYYRYQDIFAGDGRGDGELCPLVTAICETLAGRSAEMMTDRDGNEFLVITTHYPYGAIEENWIACELDEFDARFSKVHLLPVKELNGRRPIPDGINLWAPLASRNRLKFFLWHGLMPKAWWYLAKALGECFRLSQITVPRAIVCFKFSCYRVAFERNARLKSFLASDKPKAVYAYWGHIAALAIPISSREGAGTCVRYHAGDLYVHRPEAGGFYPWRQELREAADLNAFISEHALSYYSSLTRGRIGGRVGVFRLGTRDFGAPRPRPKSIGGGRPITMVSASWIGPIKRIELIAELGGELARLVPTTWHDFGGYPSGKVNAAFAKSVDAACDKARGHGLQLFLHGQVSTEALQKFYREIDITFFINLSSGRRNTSVYHGGVEREHPCCCDSSRGYA